MRSVGHDLKHSRIDLVSLSLSLSTLALHLEGNIMAKDDPHEKKPVQTEGRWARWGRTGFDKSIKISDWISPYANAVSGAVGGERFWPQSNDMPLEIEKCERILRAFTVEGIQQKEAKEEKVQDAKGNWIKKKVRVLRKIPPAAIRNAKGIAIYSSMRSGIAPLGGGGGSGVFLARLPDGSWSAPSAITPQSGAVGLLLGVDFLDVILLINSDKTMETFKSHRVDIGAETGLTAGPYGTGYSAEASYDRAPVYSYVRNRGAYAGVELLAQVFLHRFDENERFYYWPGISAGDILTGKVRIPPAVSPLHRALRDAETGRAQGGKLERTEFDIIKIPESEVLMQLGPNGSSRRRRFVAGATPSSGLSTPRSEQANGSVAQTPADEAGSLQELDLEQAANNAQQSLEREEQEEAEEEEMVREGERLRLPPTPAELEMMEAAGIPDDEDIRVAQQERVKLYQLPPPPMHRDVERHWNTHPTMGAKRPRAQLVMDGPHGPELREAQYVPLPPSPTGQVSPTLRQVPIPDENTRLMEDVPLKGTAEEEVLAQGVSEEDAEKVMEAALNGGIEEARRVGGVDDERTVEKDFQSITLSDFGQVNTEDTSVSQDTETVGSEYADEEPTSALNSALKGTNGHVQPAEANANVDGANADENPSHDTIVAALDDRSVSSHEHSFASVEDTPKLGAEKNIEPIVVDSNADLDPPVDAEPTTDTLVDPETIDVPVETKTLHPSSPRPSTPTEDNSSGANTPAGAGTQTPSRSDSKSTPSRPPRRKRPPKGA